MASPNILDQVADDLAVWIEEQAASLVEALTEGTQAPFSAPASSAERLAYYRAQFFNPDGSQNLQGREREIGRLGPEGFAGAMRAVLDHQNQVAQQAQTMSFRPAGFVGKRGSG